MCNRNAVVEAVDHENQKTVVTLKLDSIKVSTFSGDLDEWEEFKDLFEYLIHNSTRISNTVTFNELRNLILRSAKYRHEIAVMIV